MRLPVRLLLLVLLAASTPTHGATPDASTPPRIEKVEVSGLYLFLVFDQPMMTWLGQQASNAITVSPSLDCRWSWSDDTELACQAGGEGNRSPFAEATEYQLTIGPGLWSQSGQPLAPTRVSVVSAAPRLRAAATDWVRGRPTLHVSSEQPITMAAIQDVLDVTVDGEAVTYRLLPDPEWPTDWWGDVDDVAYRLELDPWPAGRSTLRLGLRPGLRSPLGPARGEGVEKLLDVEINAPFEFVESRCDRSWNEKSDTCDPETAARLYFNRALAPSSVDLIAAQLPSGVALAKHALECDWPCRRRDNTPTGALALVLTGGERAFELTLPADLEASDGERLGKATTITLHTGPYSPSYIVEPRIRLGLPGETEVAPLLARNTVAADRWTELSVGASVSERRRRVAASRDRNALSPVPTPRIPAPLLRNGGLSLGGLEGNRSTARATAVAAFQLLASDQDGQLLAWASDWATGAGIAGAKLEVLAVSRDGRDTVLATGFTDADGVGRFEVPKPGSSQGLRLLRATSGQQVTVVPLISATRMNLPNVGGGYNYTSRSESEILEFGATDRLMYRPGETVRYRLWLRQREGHRLRGLAEAAPVTLALYSPGLERDFSRWTATPDAWTSISGELRLSAETIDGFYCISTEDDGYRGNEGGPCFDVSRFAAQSLWARLDSEGDVLRAGDRLRMQVEGGYYSGGAAAFAGLEFRALATPVAFERAWPAFAAFQFGDYDRDAEGDPLEGEGLPTRLDAEGRAQLALTLPAQLLGEADEEGSRPAMPYARIQINAVVTAPGEAEASSPTQSVLFAQYPRYVGLRSEGWWLGLDADPQLEAALATADGEALPGEPVTVRIETTGKDRAARVLATCTLVSGAPAACPFRAPEPGLYALVAESEGAAPARVLRWFGKQAPPPEDADKPELVVVQASDGRSPAVLRLRQPHAAATALVVVEYEGVLRHWLQEVGPEATITVPVDPAWAPGVGVRVLLRPHLDSAEAGLASATQSAGVRVEIPRDVRESVTLAVANDRVAPGERATLLLHNPGSARRLVTIAIVDDSVHQQAAARHALLDPGGESFLGALAEWRDSRWHDLQSWKFVQNEFFDMKAVMQTRIIGGAAPQVYGNNYGGDTLDTIEVTGSRLRLSELFPAFGPQDILPRHANAPGGPGDARTRSHFVDTAYWNPGVELAPGESVAVDVPLPDNLTRWRVLAWASDADDDFALLQATLTASLPVELRLGVPSRLFEGDQGSASVSARAAGGGAAQIRLDAEAKGAGVASRITGEGAVAAQASLTRRLPLAPTDTGDIALEARATAASGADAVSSRVPVHSRWSTQRIAQAGWLDGPRSLPVPAAPAGARDVALSLTVSQGTATWRRAWLDGLHDYPHRCWEQTLSRGLGAALSLQDAAGREYWPEAQATLDEALAAAPSFQADDGRYLYFPSGSAYTEFGGDILLSAYTLRAFGWLEDLDQEVPAFLLDPLADDVEDAIAEPIEAEDRRLAEGLAVAAAALVARGDAVGKDALDALWSHWEDMSWYARSELVRALAGTPGQETRTAEGLARLRSAGKPRGLGRVISDPRDFLWAMGSDLRDQCGVTGALWDLDTSSEGGDRRRQFLRGLQDLYAGGTPSQDTQASVVCLMALRSADRAEGDAGSVQVDVELGGSRTTLSLANADATAEWRAPDPVGTLMLDTPAGTKASTHYLAELEYRQDQRDAPATATGLQLQRRYEVLRDGDWITLPAGGARDGDWIRVTLVLDVPATRQFVAITDPVPGGWVTRDPTLATVGGASLQRVADPGSWWFDTRQTGAQVVRLYAEDLPPGRHEVHYFAQALFPGRYFAPPAVAELMYGRASRATTAPDEIRVRPANGD